MTARLLDEMRALSEGQPNPDRYTPTFRSLVEAEAPWFQAEARRLGTLESLTLLEGDGLSGPVLLPYRANYSKGRLTLRIRVVDREMIDRIQIDWI